MECQRGNKEQKTGNLGSGKGDKAWKCQLRQVVAKIQSAKASHLMSSQKSGDLGPSLSPAITSLGKSRQVMSF